MDQIEKKYEQRMQRLAQLIDRTFNGKKKGEDREIGFLLLVFPFNEAGSSNVNYISSAERESMIVAMKECIARFEGQSFQSGTA